MTRRSMNNARSNVMGDREVAGVTKKSASSAKPKREVASTVYEQKKTGKSGKQLKLEERAKQKKREARVQAEAAAGRPPLKNLDRTPEEKKWLKVWWGSLALVVVTFLVAFFIGTEHRNFFIFAIVLAYIEVILSFWVQFSKLQKLQKARMNPELYRKVSKKERSHKLAEQEEERERVKAKRDARRAKLGLAPKDDVKIKGAKSKSKNGQF